MNKFLAKILRLLAKWVIKRNDPRIIAITGSVGKTSTKDAIYHVLYNQYGKMVWKSYGNLNTEIGVPMAILKFTKTPMGIGWLPVILLACFKAIYYSLFRNYPKILVLEYGADKPGDIKYLCNIAQPDIAVITEIGPAHLEQFVCVENVAKEKMYLAKNLKADGVAILNKDNTYIKDGAKDIYHEIMWYEGGKLESEKEIARIVAKIFKIDSKKLTEIMKESKKTKGRLNFLEGISQSYILDDTYNSNPLSVARALAKIKQIKKNRKEIKRIILILGDMLELGQVSEKFHKKIVIDAKKISKYVVLVGNRFKPYKTWQWYPTPMEAGDAMVKEVKKGDLILVKGSQGIRMEKIVEKLVKDRDNIEDLLVRQSKDWKKIPFKQP